MNGDMKIGGPSVPVNLNGIPDTANKGNNKGKEIHNKSSSENEGISTQAGEKNNVESGSIAKRATKASRLNKKPINAKSKDVKNSEEVISIESKNTEIESKDNTTHLLDTITPQQIENLPPEKQKKIAQIFKKFADGCRKVLVTLIKVINTIVFKIPSALALNISQVTKALGIKLPDTIANFLVPISAGGGVAHMISRFIDLCVSDEEGTLREKFKRSWKEIIFEDSFGRFLTSLGKTGEEQKEIKEKVKNAILGAEKECEQHIDETDEDFTKVVREDDLPISPEGPLVSKTA
jgi:hypothetical protein